VHSDAAINPEGDTDNDGPTSQIYLPIGGTGASERVYPCCEAHAYPYPDTLSYRNTYALSSCI